MEGSPEIMARRKSDKELIAKMEELEAKMLELLAAMEEHSRALAVQAYAEIGSQCDGIALVADEIVGASQGILDCRLASKAKDLALNAQAIKEKMQKIKGALHTRTQK